MDRIERTIDNLIDNLTATSREFIDKQPEELEHKKQQVESRLEELKRLHPSRSEIEDIVAEVIEFLFGPELNLHQGLPRTKLALLRQCIDKLEINKPAGTIRPLIGKIHPQISPKRLS